MAYGFPLREKQCKHAIVIGPTPPGTGVIADAFFETSSKSTSPTRPLSVLLIPTRVLCYHTHSSFTSWRIKINDKNVSGILVQLPLPKHIDKQTGFDYGMIVGTVCIIYAAWLMYEKKWREEDED